MATQPKIPMGRMNGLVHSTFHPSVRMPPAVTQMKAFSSRPTGEMASINSGVKGSSGIPKRPNSFSPTGGD